MGLVEYKTNLALAEISQNYWDPIFRMPSLAANPDPLYKHASDIERLSTRLSRERRHRVRIKLCKSLLSTSWCYCMCSV